MYGATDVEAWPAILGMFLGSATDSDLAAIAKFSREELLSTFGEFGLSAFRHNKHPERGISELLAAELGVQSTPMYESSETLRQEYDAGDMQAIVAVAKNLGLVDEARLDWKRVMEFRADPEAKLKLRRLRGWLDSEFQGKSLSQVEDSIATKLSDYEWALKKHGIDTIVGSLSDLLDIRFLPVMSGATAVTAIAGGPLMAALAGAGMTIGKITLSITKRLVDLKDRRRGVGSEVAFVHELKRLHRKTGRELP